MSRWAGGLGPLRTLAARIGGTSASDDSGPVVVLASEGGGTTDLLATAEALRHEDRTFATVLIAAGRLEGSRMLWRQLTPVLDGFLKSGVTAVRLVWAGAGADQPGRPAPARRIRDTWKLEVVAPAGPVVVAPGGSLFAPPGPGGPGGWWRFAPGTEPRPLGLRHPAPSWEDAAAHLVSDAFEAVEGHVIEPVPAGVLIRRAVPPPDAALSVGSSIPLDGQRLAVVVGSPGTPPVAAHALARLLTRLPPRARSTARLIPGDGRDLLGAGQQTANLLGTEVEVVSGLPALLESADGTAAEETVVLIGPDGEPSWRPYAETVACRPARDGRAPAPRIVQWRSPFAGAEAAPDGVSPLDDLWQVAVTRAGLWVGPHDGVRPGAFGWALDPSTMVLDVGEPGQRLDDGVWLVLDTLLGQLESSVAERTTLRVRGMSTTHGGRQLRRLADRRGLPLVFEHEPSGAREDERAEGAAPGTQREKEAAPAAARPQSGPEVPWHASPMSVRIRHVAAVSPAASGTRAAAPVGAAASAARAPAGAAPGARAVPSVSAPAARSARSSAASGGAASAASAASSASVGPAAFVPGAPGRGFVTTVVGSDGGPVVREPAVESAGPVVRGPGSPGVPSPRTAVGPGASTMAGSVSGPVTGAPPGFAEAYAASRAPGGPSAGYVPSEGYVPSAGYVSSEGPPASGGPVPRTPAAGERPSPHAEAAAVPPVAPAPPEPSPTSPEPPTATVVQPPTALPVRVGALHRSTPADQQALRALAGEQWWQQKAAVARTLTVMPGLRGHDQNDAVLADLTAVRSLLALDEAPMGWRWLERQLAAGSADAHPSLVCLASGLRRLPPYRGIVVRDAGTLSPEARTLPAGRELCHAGPVGAYALDKAPATARDRYLVWSLTGRRVRILTGAASRAEPHEPVVFAPGTRFQVLDTRDEHGVSTVLLREVAVGGPVVHPGGGDASGRDVLDQLLQAAGRFPPAEGAAPWPARFTGPLPERVPHGDGNA
ncbi:hypothetical protein ACWCPT_26195 [Streptomyces sp. NPDC002308]